MPYEFPKDVVPGEFAIAPEAARGSHDEKFHCRNVRFHFSPSFLFNFESGVLIEFRFVLGRKSRVKHAGGVATN